ncbi:MAG TPA: hypothetical protein VNF74_00010 [Terriglobales bacterium]|nr:hypothetical protein [Terriglobales bacterium]
MNPRVILLELNELCPALMERFMAEDHLPAFSRLYREAAVYVTDAEEHAPHLDPWIQWVTVHTGLALAQHGIHDLGDGHKLASPRTWDLVSQAGRKVWVCGSMNAATAGPVNGFVLPDPWSTGIAPQPTGEFEPFFHFVRNYVQEYTRDKVPLARGDYLRFLKFLATRGLSARTLSQTLRQLALERGGSGRWKRATILDRLQWDVFRWYQEKYQPEFATFFLNSTAHFQHFYWRNMDPEPFTVKPSESEQAEYGDAILYGYQRMDEIVGECLRLAGRDTTVVMATALSQQPCLSYESKGGKKFYRPVDYRRMLKLAGVTAAARLSPVMSEQFHIYFDRPEDAADAELKLGAWRVGELPALAVRRDGAEIFAGCCIYTELPPEARLHSAANQLDMRFYDLFYLVEGTKSGMHHPDGMLWIRTPARSHQIVEEPMSLRCVAPTLLALLEVPQPASMVLEALPLPGLAAGAGR